MQYAVGVGAKRSTSTVDLANMGVGTVTFSAKKGQTPCSGYAVCSGMQCAVVVGAKRSTSTVDLANMGGGDHYLKCKKVKPHAVGMQYAVTRSAQ